MQLPAATSSRATTLAILALAGVTLDTRLRYGNDAADPHRQLSEPDDQSGALAHLEGEVGQLKGMLGAAQSTIGGKPAPRALHSMRGIYWKKLNVKQFAVQRH